MHHPFVQSVRAASAPAQQSLSHLGDQMACPSTVCVQVPLILLHTGPKAIHIPFITAHCYNCSALLLVTGVNPLRDLLYKLNFITGVYVQKKQSMCIEHWVCPPCQAATGVLDVTSMHKQGLLYI